MQRFAGFQKRDARVHGELIIVVEVLDGGPWRQTLAAQIAETFLKVWRVAAVVGVAGGHAASRTWIAALKIYFADAESHGVDIGGSE